MGVRVIGSVVVVVRVDDDGSIVDSVTAGETVGVTSIVSVFVLSIRFSFTKPGACSRQ